MSTPIRAVGFDLWETLMTNTPEVSKLQHDLRLERMAHLLARAGHRHSADALAHAYRGSWDRCQELYWSLDRDIPCRRQVEHFLELLDHDVPALETSLIDELEEEYAGTAIEILPHAIPGAKEMLSALRARGLRIGLISNTGRTPGSSLRRILDALGLGSSIDAMVFSNEHGECKPRPSIFESLRSALDVAAGEMVFVGDNLYVDVHGAQRCGMRAIHFEPGVRGTAVAPHVDHGLEIVPDARVATLDEVIAAVDALRG